LFNNNKWYPALAALGDAFNDPHLKHTGQVLLAMEIASVREYWHVRDHNYHHFPPLIQKFGAVGMIAEQSFYMFIVCTFSFDHCVVFSSSKYDSDYLPLVSSNSS
jgi:hypothetical protein